MKLFGLKTAVSPPPVCIVLSSKSELQRKWQSVGPGGTSNAKANIANNSAVECIKWMITFIVKVTYTALIKEAQ